MADLTQARLKEVLNYDPETGLFRWKVTLSNRAPSGKIAGRPDANGHRVINIDGVVYRAARLAWLYVHGKWPDNQIDHRNTIRSDDRVDNLRDATPTQNSANRRVFRSGLKGASRIKNYGWMASISANRKKHYLGFFKTEEEAHAAYVVAAREYFGEFARED